MPPRNLIGCNTEAETRALDAQCLDLASPTSRRVISELSVQPSVEAWQFMINYVICNCANLVRCGMAGGLPVVPPRGVYDAPLLSHAAQAGNLRVMRAILDGGGAVDATDPYGNSSLMAAIGKKRTRAVELLAPLSNTALTNRNGLNALHLCVLTGFVEGFEALLPHVSDVDLCTVSAEGFVGKQTALHLACAKDQYAMARALLRRGASRTAVDELGRTPLMMAAEEGALSCLKLLDGRSDKVKMTPGEVAYAAPGVGWTALHLAAYKGHASCVGALIAAGAQRDAEGADGETPLDLAEVEHSSNAALLGLLSPGSLPDGMPGTVCDNCGSDGGGRPLKTCTSCYAACYCSTACSAARWPLHRPACKQRSKERKRGLLKATSVKAELLM